MWVTPRQTDRSLHVLGPNYSEDFIQFYEFLKILRVCTDRNFTEIAQFLINSNSFLLLDFYEYSVDHYNLKESDYEFKSKSDILGNITFNHKLNFYKYDAFMKENPPSYPIEDFLSEVSQNDYLENFRLRDLNIPLPNYYTYYWKVEDLLKVDYIVELGLNIEIFKICKDVVINGSSIILEYYKENKELKGLQVGTKYINEQLEGAQDTIKTLRNKVYRLEEQKTLSKSRGIKPKAGISTEKQQAKEAARILAKTIWKADSNKKIKMLMMCDEVYSNLHDSDFCDQLPDQPKSIKSWIASEAPKYAREAGRPSEK